MGRSNLSKRRSNLSKRRSNLSKRRSNLSKGRSNLSKRRSNLSKGRSNLSKRRSNLSKRRGKKVGGADGEGEEEEDDVFDDALEPPHAARALEPQHAARALEPPQAARARYVRGQVEYTDESRGTTGINLPPPPARQAFQTFLSGNDVGTKQIVHDYLLEISKLAFNLSDEHIVNSIDLDTMLQEYNSGRFENTNSLPPNLQKIIKWISRL
jgi:hypothetical protein